MNIKWKTVIIGIIIALILNFILLMVAGVPGGYIADLLATIYVGYTVGGDYRNGAVHGAIVGFVTNCLGHIIGGIVVLINIGVHTGGFDFLLLYITLIGAIIVGIEGAIGGSIGVLIKREVFRGYHADKIEPEKNFEKSYATPKKINAPIKDNWKKQIYVRSFFIMGLVTTGQGFMSLSKGNKVGFIIFILAAGFFLAAIFFYITRKNINKKQRSKWDMRRSTEIPSKNSRDSLPVEESYYYKGKTNQQLHHYNEALNCYSKSLEFNPDFEPAKKAKREVEKIILNRN